MIKDALVVVLRDICYRANIWHYMTRLYLVTGIQEYTLDPLPETEVATVQTIIRPDLTRLESRDTFPPFRGSGKAS